MFALGVIVTLAIIVGLALLVTIIAISCHEENAVSHIGDAQIALVVILIILLFAMHGNLP